MARTRARSVVILSMASLCLDAVLPVRTLAAEATVNKGAQVYCFMRGNGNDHAVSFEAAYALIKRQKSGVFKTSPEHAAVMITESVVLQPETYPDCGRYLGDLFGANKRVESSGSTQPQAAGTTETETTSPTYGEERYSY